MRIEPVVIVKGVKTAGQRLVMRIASLAMTVLARLAGQRPVIWMAAAVSVTFAAGWSGQRPVIRIGGVVREID